MTGLTEVTLRKVYKELLENWDDLLPPNYTPAVPPEKAFPTTAISSGRSSTPRGDAVEVIPLDKDKSAQPIDLSDTTHQVRGKNDVENNGNVPGVHSTSLNQPPAIWPQLPFGTYASRTFGKSNHLVTQADSTSPQLVPQESESQMDIDKRAATSSVRPTQLPSPPASTGSVTWPFQPPSSSGPSMSIHYSQTAAMVPGFAEVSGSGSHDGSRNPNQSKDN